MSSPAKAGDPVFTAARVRTAPPAITGCPACAGHDIIWIDDGVADVRPPRSDPRRQEPSVHRRGISGIAARRPRGLYLRRAGQGRHRASGVPQCGGIDRAALRRPARRKNQSRAHGADRYRLERLYPQILQGGAFGRSPDYKAAFLNTLGANAEFYGKFADNARAWHKRAQEAVLYLNHALVNP